MPESKKTARPQFLSVPTWDITDEEISEWRKTPGTGLAGLAAERIRDGEYDNGQEIYPPGSGLYKEVTRESISGQMALLVERGMVRESGGRWYAIAPGRMEPSVLRATNILLDRRPDLPPALAAELDSWKRTLDAIQADQQRESGQKGKPGQSAKPTPGTKAA
jgi:hypothetical protein